MNEEEKKPDEPEEDPEPLPPRRRVRLSYRAADRTMKADQMMIVMALVVGLFMLYSRGCQSSLQGLTQVLTEEPAENPDAGVPEPSR